MVASVGEAAVSAVSLVDSVNTLIFYGFAALATGGAVVCGQFLGCRNIKKKPADSAEQLIVFIFVFAIALTAILFAVKRFILHGLFGDIEADVMGYANTYYLIVEASIPFIALYNAGAALFRVMGNSAVSMKISIGMNIINVCGNALLIFVVHMGVEGVAIPTLVSRIIGAFAVIWLLRSPQYSLHISRPFHYRFDGHTVKNILRIGVPSGIENSLFHLGKLMLLSVVSAFGTASIAANAIGNSLATFQILAPQAIGVGMITVISQCVGARDFQSARFYTRKLMKWAYVSMAAVNIVIFLLLPLILYLYNVSAEATEMARLILLLHGLVGIALWPASFTLPQTLKAAGDTTFVMAVCRRLYVDIPHRSRYPLRQILGTWCSRIWLAMFIDWFCRIVFFVIRYRGQKWEKKYVK